MTHSEGFVGICPYMWSQHFRKRKKKNRSVDLFFFSIASHIISFCLVTNMKKSFCSWQWVKIENDESRNMKGTFYQISLLKSSATGNNFSESHHESACTSIFIQFKGEMLRPDFPSITPPFKTEDFLWKYSSLLCKSVLNHKCKLKYFRVGGGPGVSVGFEV